MTSDPNSLPSEWLALNEKQLHAAEYLAAGYSQNRTSQIVGVEFRTINRWMNEKPGQAYRDYVLYRREELMREARPLYDSTLLISLRIHHGALTGEYSPTAPEVVLAREVLRETVWKLGKPGPVDKPLGHAEDQQQLPPG